MPEQNEPGAGFVRSRRLHARGLAAAAGIALASYLAVAYGVLPLLWTEAERGRHPALESLPEVTHNADGIAGDPLNVALVGDEAELVAAMLAAGWHPADPITLESSLRIAESVVLHRPDPDAPVSALYVFGRRQDLAFEQDVGGSADQRQRGSAQANISAGAAPARAAGGSRPRKCSAWNSARAAPAAVTGCAWVCLLSLSPDASSTVAWCA